eukprot:CAMPEP_0172610718 /NCGR_PEP_ID=MMETSP1068-20121228/30486_1 /TAXON_ID=35684 /ORGANISM="Pseudopedinella elastica, Strain CCMP716" /LENGTH=236 /DNA_ID=CAMNT_0013414499 /DNA_START=70 /DNA_END=780 /DNA_ORIENTATION=+
MAKSLRIFALLVACEAFAPGTYYHTRRFTRTLGKKEGDEAETLQAQTLPVGSIVEFDDGKGRFHIGKVKSVEHKSNGKARYAIQDAEEHLFNVADKQVRFSAGCPASPKDEAAVFKDIMAASQASPAELRAKLDLDAEVLELAWEEVAASEDGLSTVTAKDFVELVHSRPPKSAGEAYCAWRFLKEELGSVFFKAIKEGGKITSFKAKAEKAVNDAKQAFCSAPQNLKEEPEFCFV